jgi:biotin transport system substrate-specific component
VSSVLVYITQGAVGLPFFAKGGAGLAYLRGVTGGYLVGFVAAAFVVGLLVERGLDRKIKTVVLAMVAGNIVIYGCGVLWLQVVLSVSLNKAMMLGVYPFIPGDVYKIALASFFLPVLWSCFGRFRDKCDS